MQRVACWGILQERYEKKYPLPKTLSLPLRNYPIAVRALAAHPAPEGLPCTEEHQSLSHPFGAKDFCAWSLGEKMSYAIIRSLCCRYSSFACDTGEHNFKQPPLASTFLGWSPNQGALKMCFPKQRRARDPGQGCWQEETLSCGLGGQAKAMAVMKSRMLVWNAVRSLFVISVGFHYLFCFLFQS